MKKIEEKKEMIQNFEGFYLMRGIILFENPDSSLVNIVANFRFEKPQYISSDLNIIMGKGVQIANKDTISNILSVGVSNLVGNNLFNNSPLIIPALLNIISLLLDDHHCSYSIEPFSKRVLLNFNSFAISANAASS